MPSALRRSCLIFLAAFAVYLRSVAGTFNINDSGETITVGYNFWIGHSPGYPLHTTLSKLFCGLPFGNPMFLVSLASVVFASLAVALLPFLLERYGFSAAASSIATVLFALSENFWFQAGGAKGGIYTLGTLFMVLILFVIEHVNQSASSPARWTLLGFVVSLMLGHHWQSMAMAPAWYILLLPSLLKLYRNPSLLWGQSAGLFAIACMATGFRHPLVIAALILVLGALPFVKNILNGPGAWFGYGLGVFALLVLVVGVKVAPVFSVMMISLGLLYPFAISEVRLPMAFLGAGVGLLMGLTPILVLPLRAIHPMTLNWGEPSRWARYDPSGRQLVSGLEWTLAREGYKGIGDTRSRETIVRNLRRFWLDMKDQFFIPIEAAPDLAGPAALILLLLGAGGAALLARAQPRAAAGVGVLGFSVAAAVVLYSNSKAGYEWTVDNFFVPFYFLMAFYAGPALGWAVERAAGALMSGPALKAAGPLSSLLLGLGLWMSNAPHCAQRDYLMSWDYGYNLLKSSPPNSLIMCAGDIDILPLWYMKYVEKARPDVQVVTCQLLPYDWYRRSLAREDSRSALPVFGDLLVPMETAGEMLMRAALQYGRPVVYTFIYTRPFMQKFPSRVRGIMWEVVPEGEVHKPYDPVQGDRDFLDFRLRGVVEPDVYKDDYTQVLVDSYGTARDATGFVALREAGEASTKAADKLAWYRTAIHEFQRAIPLRSPQAQSAIHANMGAAYRGLADLEGALNEYRRAELLGSSDPVLHYNFGITLLQAGRAPEAGMQFRSCVALAQDINLVRLAGVELQKLGDGPGVEAAVAKFRMLQPQTQPNP